MKDIIRQKNYRMTKPDNSFLKDLGLSEHQIRVYEVLVFAKIPFTAQEIAEEVMIYPNAVYRIFKELAQLGLIRKTARRPVAYIAVEKDAGFNTSYLQKQQLLLQALSESGVKNGEAEKSVIVGRQQLYEAYINFASNAETDIAVFSAGIAYSKELYKAQKNAVNRGVLVRHIVQHVDSSNYHIIHKWKQLGVDIRRLETKQGFHLTIIDHTTALITFSNPRDTEDRITIVTKHATAVELFRLQFEQMWAQAKVFEVA